MNYWSQFSRAHCYPNCGCEPLVDLWIMQPWAFWSSFTYAIAGFILYRKVEKKTFELKLWTVIMYYLTVSSLFAHASYTRLALAMDFSSIIVLIGLASFINLLFYFKKSEKQIAFILIPYVALLVGFFYFVGGWARISLCLIVFFFSLWDLVRSRRKEIFHQSSKPLWMSLWILVFSFAAFLVDTTSIICRPDSWIHGHTLWHLGTAMSSYYYGKWRFKPQVL
jgi:hypothetical protein